MKKALLLVGVWLTLGSVACGPQDSLSDEVPVLLNSTESEFTASNCTVLAPTSVLVWSETGNPATNTLDDRLDTRWSNLGKGSSSTTTWARRRPSQAPPSRGTTATTRANTFTRPTPRMAVNYTQVYTGQNSATTRRAETTRSRARTARRLRITVKGNNLNDWASIAEARPCAGPRLHRLAHGRCGAATSRRATAPSGAARRW